MFTSAAAWLVASAVSRYRIDWFIPAMFLVIGGRHLTFATWFGWRVDWVCALAAHPLTAVRKEEAH